MPVVVQCSSLNFIIICPYIYLAANKRCICIHQFKTRMAYGTWDVSWKCPTDRKPIFKHSLVLIETHYLTLVEQWNKCVWRKSNFQSDFASMCIWIDETWRCLLLMSTLLFLFMPFYALVDTLTSISFSLSLSLPISF